MAKNKVNKAAGEAQEPLKEEKTYKITCGIFKSRNEALEKAAEARRAGVYVSIVIKETGYCLLCAEGILKAEAEEAKKKIEAKGIKAEVSEK